MIKTRAGLNKAYGRIGSNGTNDTDSDDFSTGTSSPTMAEETEFGFVGFDAPLG